MYQANVLNKSHSNDSSNTKNILNTDIEMQVCSFAHVNSIDSSFVFVNCMQISFEKHPKHHESLNLVTKNEEFDIQEVIAYSSTLCNSVNQRMQRIESVLLTEIASIIFIN